MTSGTTTPPTRRVDFARASVSRRTFLVAGGIIPALPGCADGLVQPDQRPLDALARDLGVCAATYAVLRSGRPGAPVSVCGCSGCDGVSEAIYQAASLTKPVVAFAALRLVQGGELDLEAPTSRYLPTGYRHFHDVFARAPGDPHDNVVPEFLHRIPVRVLLNHTSGLPNWTSGPLAFGFEPGTRWSYSGEGFVILQRVIEAVTGQELAAYFNRHVFAPLGMADSSLVWRDDYLPRAVGGTTAAGRQPHRRIARPVAASSLYTTASDYAKFMAAWLDDDRLLALALSRPVTMDRALGLEWGLGWGIEHADGGPYIWQWGNNPGFRAFAMASVGTKHGFVILTNSECGMPLAASLAGRVLPTEHRAFRHPLVG